MNGLIINHMNFSIRPSTGSARTGISSIATLGLAEWLDYALAYTYLQAMGVTVMSLRGTGLTAFAAISLVGCMAAKEEPPPPPLPPTKVELHVEAAQDVNANAQGKGSPVLLRIYELKGVTGFNAADYFALYDKDQTALGADLGRKQEIMLRPGEKQTLLLQPEPGVGFFAAYAGFRNLDSARWRVSAPIPPHATSVFELKLAGSQLTLTTPPPAQAPQAPAEPPK